MKDDFYDLEKRYIAATNSEHRKALGQIFTPPRVAQWMTRWVTSKITNGRILDPALGLGIFFRNLWELYHASQPQEEMAIPSTSTRWMEMGKQVDLHSLEDCSSKPTLPPERDFPYTLDGYEVDPYAAAQVGESFVQQGIPLNCRQDDFLMAEIETMYDGIICNPPYIHFQEYKHSLTLIQKFNQQYGMELNGFSNIYALFLIKALHLLKPGGRAAFILPSEFLNADYGTAIKSLLVETGSLAKLIIFDPSVQVFPGFLTTSAIFLFEQGWVGEVEMFTVHNVAELDEVESFLYTSSEKSVLQPKRYPFDQLDPYVKWRYYYGDLKINLHLQQRANLTPLHTFANVRRGIATGANRFFTVSEADRKRHNIAMEYLTPCLTRASQVQGHIFGEQEFSELAEAGKNVFLLNLTGKTLDASMQEYIRWGEDEGFHRGYLTRNRRPWYSMEPALPADLWVKTFGRSQVVFIENNTRALHLTCFHGIYLNMLGYQYRKVIFLYLITDLAREIFEGQKREYGSGLGKFEPNDIRNANVLDFRQLATPDLSVLEQLYTHYVQVYRSAPHTLAEISIEAEQIFVKYW